MGASCAEDLIKVKILPDGEKGFQIGAGMKDKDRVKMLLLVQNIDGIWVEELLNVLCAYRTTPRRSTGETPFSLTNGGEAVIPTEVSLCSARVSRFVPIENEELMINQLDSLEEHWESAIIKLAEYQQMLARQYNQHVKSREFSTSNLVLRKVVGNAQDTNAGKLAPN
ncbi:uncharacterized protein LOC111986999 [Quercus suber]|uniref:uncharacterized protein LOC111986999 n=1 Tax=Quercus suber TaxID=58331 RepID=UPI000CE28DB1|nr:uncharacterized protein LOC111986999 [Quercus suber]